MRCSLSTLFWEYLPVVVIAYFAFTLFFFLSHARYVIHWNIIRIKEINHNLKTAEDRPLCHIMRKRTFWHMRPRGLKSACASTQSDWSLRCRHEETTHPWLFKMRAVKILIRLREFTSWSEFSLGAHFRSITKTRLYNIDPLNPTFLL